MNLSNIQFHIPKKGIHERCHHCSWTENNNLRSHITISKKGGKGFLNHFNNKSNSNLLCTQAIQIYGSSTDGVLSENADHGGQQGKIA